MRLKCKFVINTIAGETVAVPVGDQNTLKGYIRLNETGKDIFELLEKETEREKIIADMMIKYPDATQAEICESVDGIIEKLSAAELLV